MIAFRNKSDKLFDILNITLLLIIMLLVLYPLILVLSYSFSNPDMVMQGKVVLFPKKISLIGYERVFRNADILTGYRNTIIYTVVGTLINLIMTTLAAYPLSRKDFSGKNLIMALLTFTMFFNGGIIPTYLLVKDLGLINNMWALIIPGAVSVWNVIIMRTYFQSSIPEEIYEAAFIDGCTNIKMLTKIVVPLSPPIIAVLTLFYGVGHWNSYFNALIYITKRELFPLQLILREILVQFNMSAMLSNSTDSALEQISLSETIKYSVIVASSLPVILAYPFLQKYFIKGIMVGAIKG